MLLSLYEDDNVFIYINTPYILYDDHHVSIYDLMYIEMTTMFLFTSPYTEDDHTVSIHHKCLVITLCTHKMTAHFSNIPPYAGCLFRFALYTVNVTAADW